MTYHAGLDVSFVENAICMARGTGTIVKEMRAESEPRALHDALVRLGLPLERVGIRHDWFSRYRIAKVDFRTNLERPSVTHLYALL